MKYLIYAITAIALSLTFTSCQTETDYREPAIIPEPQLVITAQEKPSAIITPKTTIVAKGVEELKSASFFQEYLMRYYGIQLKIETINSKAKNNKEQPKTTQIEFNISPLTELPTLLTEKLLTLEYSPQNLEREGAYYLNVTDKKITLTGANPQGLFYAMQSLIQLLPTEQQKEISVKQTQVVDFPRFEYRGMHLDVVRHIYSIEYIKQYIDYIALHKMNYFHWHLTDDQGWRMESKSHPKLNRDGAYRAGTIIGIFPGTGVDSTRYGGYYTIEQMKEIVNYAQQRYITVVPEIDVPGHSMAILATYPQFSTTPDLPKEPAITWGIYNRQNNVLAPSEEVFSFLSDVFNELMDVFPGPYIHIGADECAKKWWQESQKTQEFMKKHNLKDEGALQKYFAQRISEIIHARGRQFIGWDEMVDNGLVEGAIVMSWRNAKNGLKAAELGHKTIMTPVSYSYLNVAQRENEDSLCHKSRVVSLDSVYNFEPVPKETPAKIAANVLGGQGCMWTEYFPHRQRLEYGLFPRMSAIAEVYWTLPKNKSLKRFKQKLKTGQYPRYTLWGANFYQKNQ